MISKIILFPYYSVLKVRHFMYDHNFIKKSVRSEIPTISVGNITVGGTGKTPHVEMIIRLLREQLESSEIAVLSRGYKRKKRGYKYLDEYSSAVNYGDEPVQIKKKFPGISVAVDKNRVRGCRNFANLATPPKVVILDDAFQYRALKPDLNIVLVDCNRPIYDDELIPFGSLRDLPERISKADIVVVTKCSEYIEEPEMQEWAERLKVERGRLFFTRIKYCEPTGIYPECDKRYIYSKRIILVTGISKDTPLRNYLSDNYQIVEHFRFSDHHKFRRADIRQIKAASKKWPTAAIVTTEKDAQRLMDYKKFPSSLKDRIFQVPIETAFIPENRVEDFHRDLESIL